MEIREQVNDHRRKERRSKSLFIAFAGAQGTGKSTLAAALKPEVEKLINRSVTLIEGVARTMKDKGFAIDKDATLDSKWAIEAAYTRIEQQLKDEPKIFCRSVIDRFAYARAGGIDMDMYYEKMVPAYINMEYDVILYTPIEERVVLVGDGVRNTDPAYQRKVDTEIRKILKDYQVPMQIMKGSVEDRCALAMEYIRLRLGR